MYIQQYLTRKYIKKSIEILLNANQTTLLNEPSFVVACILSEFVDLLLWTRFIYSSVY